MMRERYFKELAIVLQKEGFTPLPEQEQRLPVAWKERHLFGSLRLAGCVMSLKM